MTESSRIRPAPPVRLEGVMCPFCCTLMVRAGDADRWHCRTCPRYALPGDAADDIERHETERQRAVALLDSALGRHDELRTHDRMITDEMEARMGQRIDTRGCSRCGGTMYKTIETDDNGNPTSETQYVCSGCGNVE